MGDDPIEQAVREIVSEIMKERAGSIARKTAVEWEIFVENVLESSPAYRYGWDHV